MQALSKPALVRAQQAAAAASAEDGGEDGAEAAAAAQQEQDEEDEYVSALCSLLLAVDRCVPVMSVTGVGDACSIRCNVTTRA
jgi:hypothetical protein